MTKDETRESHNKLIISYLTLRRFIGLLGIGLPLLCLMYAGMVSVCGVEPSISTYYHTGLQNAFVGILCVLGTFLLTYNGYDTKESVTSSIGGIFAILTAFFPTDVVSGCEQSPAIDAVVGNIHLACAAGLFVVFAYMSLALFTRSHSEYTTKGLFGLFRDKSKEAGMGKRKLQRNNVYRLCGWIVLVSIALMFVNSNVYSLGIADFTFYGETLSLFAFGASWLVKSQTLYREPSAKAALEAIPQVAS